MLSMKLVLIAGAVLANLAIAFGAMYWPPILWAYLFVGPTTVIMIHDLLQKDHTLLRNYPVVGHFRYMIEDFRLQFRQYLIESDLDGRPFSHAQRAVVYQRSKDQTDVLPFGTLQHIYTEGYEWLEHSVNAREPQEREPRVRIGNSQCSQPYEASHFNISAMSFGSISANAVEALNLGAKIGGFAQDTGEGGLSRHHLKHGGDVIWEIGTGYFGCRTDDGGFDRDQFRDKSRLDTVKMTELKLSQGAKPGGGGILPGNKVTREIAETRGLPVGKTVLSPASHKVFSTPVGMMEFIQEMRELSGGKPVGMKFCLGQETELMAMLKAMRETGIKPDFITLDGSEGGTGAAPVELSNSVGTPLTDALIYLHNALCGAELRDDIRIIATGKIITGFDIASRIAQGADLCNSARGMMFAVGCIQARRCHTNRCPTGVATMDPWRVSGLVVEDKAERVARYHEATIEHFLKILAACGLDSPSRLCPELLNRRISHSTIRNYSELYPTLEPGQLLRGEARDDYQKYWDRADPSRFEINTACADNG